MSMIYIINHGIIISLLIKYPGLMDDKKKFCIFGISYKILIKFPENQIHRDELH